jgi:hypothetical protein
MAKRKASGSSRAKSESPELNSDALSAMQLASPVAAIVNLSAVIAQEFSAFRTAEGMPDVESAVVDLSLKVSEVSRVDQEHTLHVSVSFELKVHDATRKEDKKRPLVVIACKLLLVYDVPTFDGLSDENLVAFAQTSGTFSAWPYWREFVHSSSFRLGIEPIVLPTYHR